MAKDPWARPSAEELLRHPFVAGTPPADLRAFMRCMYNEEEKLADAVMIVTARYYNNLAHNWHDSDSIAAFYAADAALDVAGGGGGGEGAAGGTERCRGRYTVAQHFHHLMQGLSFQGETAFDVQRQRHEVVAEAAGPDGPLVTMSQRVIMRNERRYGEGGAQVLGVFDDTMTVRLHSLDAVLPGGGFVITAQAMRWVQAPPARKAGRETPLTPPKCRQQ
jgi:hypothetical protein